MNARTPQFRLILYAVLAVAMVSPAASSKDIATVFDVAAEPDFAGYREPLINFLKSHHARAPSTVCLLGERKADGTKTVWVIWREGKKMVLWDGGDSSMITARRILDLRHDVVAREDDVGGSTYLVSRAWVADQNRRCELSGTNIRLLRSDLK